MLPYFHLFTSNSKLILYRVLVSFKDSRGIYLGKWI